MTKNTYPRTKGTLYVESYKWTTSELLPNFQSLQPQNPRSTFRKFELFKEMLFNFWVNFKGTKLRIFLALSSGNLETISGPFRMK